MPRGPPSRARLRDQQEEPPHESPPRLIQGRTTRGVATWLILGVLTASAQAQTPPARAKATADGLLNALRTASTEEAAAALEAQLQTIWANAGSPAVKLLLSRAGRELSEGASGDSLDSFDAALDLDPDLLEGWRGRAKARLRMGDTAGAVRDLQEVIKREPRDFAAWQDLSRVAEARGDWHGALSAWQKLLEMDPHSPGSQVRLKELRRRALGEDA